MERASACIKGRLAVLFLIIVFLRVSAVWAAPASPEQARDVVENWLALDGSPLGARLGQQTKSVITYEHDGTSAYYVVYLIPEGFVIVPADDMVEPIIGFLPKGEYDPSPENPLGALVSVDMSGRISAVQEMERQVQGKGIKLDPADVYALAKRKWEMLARPSGRNEALETMKSGEPTISSIRVSPLVQSAWSQSTVYGGLACYNYYTPPHAAGSASNYVCGCVATAMAQVMRFWQYPATGVGTGSYDIKIDGFPTPRNLRGGDGSGGAYNWASMPLTPGSGIAEQQRQAVGALTHDAGVSVNMEYTSSSSGADTLKVSTAFVSTFGYSSARNAYSGNSGTSIPVADRNNMVNPNLDAGYPAIMGIRGSAGGHAIVCDGYGYNTATLYHHLNMGWGGYEDAWYNLPTVETVPYNFDVQTSIVYNVYITGSGEIISGRVAESSGRPVSGVTVTATGTGGPFTATTNARGIYALPKVLSDSAYSVSAVKKGYTFTPNPQPVTTGTSTSYTTTTGNRWGIDFVAEGGIRAIVPIYDLLLLN
ncbi:MAG: C10 family peptidase [Deltaproteobacteria bacterium]|nr:C10 family peptidase [Deltaproteobacteria bacterium]